jgi:hypothetical protein
MGAMMACPYLWDLQLRRYTWSRMPGLWRLWVEKIADTNQNRPIRSLLEWKMAKIREEGVFLK